MNESRNLILAVVFSILVMLGWELFFAKRQQADIKQVQAKIASKEVGEAHLEKIVPEDVFIPVPKEISLEKSSNTRIAIKSENLLGSINLKGLSVDDIALPNYKETIEKDAANVTIFSPKDTSKSHFLEFGWLSSNSSLKLPNKDSLWTADKKELTANSTVTFSWNNSAGVTFITAVTLDENYLFSVKQSVKNATKENLVLFPYALINKIHDDGQELFISHEGPILVADGILQEVNYSKIKENEISKENIKGWLGFSDKYWMSAIVPEGDFSANISHYKKEGINRYQADYRGKPVLAKAGEQVSTNTKFIVGAKRLSLLDNYSEKYNIVLLDRAIDFGWFYFITKPMSIALTFLGSVLGNFGLAILLFTVFVKACLYPLAYKSYVSMGKMRELMPELQKLKEKHKGDSVKFNQEVIGFYKKKKINPAAGCLPILLQIPIFFALYKTLFISIEMRHAPFIGWIKDLSAPDTSTIFNLFGLLNYDLPSFVPHIGVLPILFCISMIIQQKLQPKPTDETQAFVLKWLPFIFLFLFASFPAGLVIYWAWSNTLSILQQLIINYKIKKKEIK